jgi:hypothetical protein
MKKPDHQPIQEEYKQVMNSLGRLLDGVLNPGTGPKRTGFALLVFPFGQPNGEHRSNYVSNANRDDMIATLKEFIARAEGRYHE